VPGYVIKRLFHNVRKHTKLAHICCAGSAKIVDSPGRNAYALIKLLLGTVPIGEAALAKDELCRVASRLASKDRRCLPRQRHDMFAPIFHTMGRQHDTPDIDLGPCKFSYLVPALAQEEE